MTTYSGGVRKDVTAQAQWSSSNPDVLEVAAGGQVTAVQDGDAGVIAEFEGNRGVHAVLVIEPGTYTLTGAVMDAGFGLEGTRVEVLSGQGAGKAATTDGSGNYKLYGLAGEVQVRASREGYEPVDRGVSVTSHRRGFNFALRPSVAPRDFSGTWRLTFEASAGCASLPQVLQRRTYTATVQQSVSALSIQLSDATFAPDPWGSPGDLENRFSGRASGDSVTLRLSTYSDFYYGTHYDLEEIVAAYGRFTVVGEGTGQAQGSLLLSGSFAGTLSGSSPQPGVFCTASDHRFSLVRQTTAASR